MYQLKNDKLTNEVCMILRLSDNANIPLDTKNKDYQEYLMWVDGYEKEWNPETKLFDWVKTSEGNTPIPADE